MDLIDDGHKAYHELKAWRKREDNDNGFSKNIHRDAYQVLTNNYDVLLAALTMLPITDAIIKKKKSTEEKIDDGRMA